MTLARFTQKNVLSSFAKENFKILKSGVTVEGICSGAGFIASDGHYSKKAVPLHKIKSA